MVTVLWTNADIANELGISTGAVYNWSYYKQRSIKTPQPFAVTKKGAALWSEEQAQKMMSEYRALEEKRKQTLAEKKRIEDALERMIWQP